MSGTYKFFREGYDEVGHRNWVHFERCARLARELAADEREFIRAQFLLATPTSYPYPSNLYSRRAVGRWKLMDRLPRAIDTWSNYEYYRKQYGRRFGLTSAEVVANPAWHFQAWYRALFMEERDLLMVAVQALEQLRSAALRKVICDNGIDLAAIERRLRRVVKGG